ncbi:MAG: hypothetical protein AAF633_21185 [Chloroflexota bacterium]
MKLEKNFQIVQLRDDAVKQLMATMKSLGDIGKLDTVLGAKGPSGTKCSHTKAGLEPFGGADFECEDSD